MDNFGNTIEYEMTERYFLKDISFGASLYNEQTLNRGDAGYDPYDDYGSYFTGFDYSYNGKFYKEGEFSEEDFESTLMDTAIWALSCLDGIPVLGTITSTIGQIYDLGSLAYDWLNIAIDYFDDISGTLESVEKSITATCFYQNRDDQLRYNRDTNNVPYLIKTAAIGFNTGSDESIWYGVNDNVTGYFSIGHSALNERNPEYTRFTNNIVLKVVDRYDNEFVATSQTIVHKKFRNPNSKSLSIDKTDYIYLLPDGENYFTFDAVLASDYDIQIDSSENIKVLVNGEFYEGKQLNIRKSISENSTINLKIYGNKKGIYAPLTISPKKALANIDLPARTNYLVKLGDIAGIKTIKANYSEIYIKDFYFYGEPELIPYESFGYFESDDEISYPFTQGNICYYAVLYNTYTSSRAGVSLSISEIPTVNLGVINTVKLMPNLTYYKFTAPTGGGQFIQTVTNTSNDEFIYKMLDSNLNPITNGYSHTKGEYIISLEGNKTYYIATSTGYDENNAKIVINKANKAYQWQVTGGSYSNYKTYERELRLVRGYTYTLKFLINDQIFDTAIFSEDDINNDFSGYNISVSSTGKLSIPLTTPIGGSGITVKARFDTDTSYNHTLKVIPEFENTISSLSTFNNTDFGFSFTAPKYVKAYDYSISIGGYTKDYINQSISNYANSTNKVSKSIAANYNSIGYTGVGYIQIKITKLYVATASNGTATYTCNYSTQVHNLFKSGSGTSSDPYVITCDRHLNNIRNAANKYFILSENIDLGGAEWSPIDNFSGALDGNGKNISNFKMISKITGTGKVNYGFFRKVVGTVKNITFNKVSVDIDSKPFVFFGVVAGNMAVNSCIYNCKVTNSGTITVKGSTEEAYVGGIVGYIQGGTLEKCSFGNKLSVTNISRCEVGGLVGRNTSGNIYKSYSSGEINVYSSGSSINLNVGGIVGRNTYNPDTADIPQIINCYSTANVIADCVGQSCSVYVGGLAGVIKQSLVKYCYATGTVTAKNNTGKAYAGGFSGQIVDCVDGGLVNNIFATGDVYARGNYSGAETSYSFFGRLCGAESNNSFYYIYYNKNSKFKDGLTGKEVTWNTSWYTGKTESQLKSASFLKELGFSSDIWNITGTAYPTLK